MVEDCQIFTVPGNNFKRKEKNPSPPFHKKRTFITLKNFYFGHATCRILPSTLGMQPLPFAMEVGAAPTGVPASPLRFRGQLQFRLPLPTKSELRSGSGRGLARRCGGGSGWEGRDVWDPRSFPGAGPRTPPDARAARPRAPGRGNESPGRAEARSEREKIEHRKQKGKTKSI